MTSPLSDFGSAWKEGMARIADNTKLRIGIIAAIVALTTAIHYGWVLEPIFGDQHWIHAVHTRFCYVPIVISAAWFGWRGGILTALTISVAVLPYIFGSEQTAHNLAGELVELVFYFALGGLIGALVDREWRARRRETETRLQLERSQKLSLVGQVAAGVAHELKNPLASIKGAVEIIADESTSDQDRGEFRNILLREIKRMDGTVSEFLEFARPKPVQLERLDLSELVRASTRQIEAQAAKAGILLREEIESGLIVAGDREKLHQLALNLLLNAIQASPSGSELEVSLRRDAKQALVNVRDHGEGIAAADLERIFEPFYTTRASGSGLGLPIVRSIVEAHDGTIEVMSVPGQGTTAAVRIPLAS